ncbi:Hsp70 suppressor, GTPase facilitates ribosomal subunit dissociation [Maudiozyma exigua]|uniref:Hsp70 suppressor, GTPase facilitates ribosomal subunit dissociation n=1 Tax=Maudiozyma exigua TaxID=34358 RepID=A0A9P6WE67_MAUEX|nr:Hsp70 suppressor, GTPase facilitates ribosomal subunit dissociation [Kazachstania exigua]
MSKLEQFAKQRLLNKQSASDVNALPKNENNSKSVSLLDRLKNAKNEKKNDEPKLSLSDILKRSKGSTTSSDKRSSKLNSLSSRLHDLQTKKENEETESNTELSAKSTVINVEVPKGSNTIISKESDKLRYIRQSLLDFQKITKIDNSSVTNKLYRISSLNNSDECIVAKNKIKNKRILAELNAVFSPSNKRQRITENFHKLSPDDEVLEAQTGAFNDVTKKVANLSIKPPKRLRKKEDTEKSNVSKDERINPQIYMSKNRIQPTISVITLGHENSGKSTLVGKLLYDLGHFKIQDVNDLKIKLERSVYKEDNNLFWSWLLDYDKKSSELSEKSLKIETLKYGEYNYKVTDFPGTKKAITSDLVNTIGASDIVVLVIDCGIDGFENGFNLNGQIIEHCILASSLKVKKLIIAMNKLDTIDWNEERFEDIKRELLPFLNTIGFENDQVNFVPCCSIVNSKEDGLFKPVYQQMCPWNKNMKSVFELIQDESAMIRNEKVCVNNEPLIISVTNSESANSRCIGLMRCGNIQKGDIVRVLPQETTMTVQCIRKNGKEVPIGLYNDKISLEYKPANENNEINLDTETIDITTDDIITSIDDSDLTMKNQRHIILDVQLFDVYDTNISAGNKFRLFSFISDQDVKVNKVIGNSGNVTRLEVEISEPFILKARHNDIILRNNMNRTICFGKIIQ